MGNATAHLLASIEGIGALLAAGRIETNGTTVSFTKIGSPLWFASDISTYRLGAGRYQVNLNNFRGPQGFVVPVVSAGSTSTAGGGAGSAGLSSSISLNSYTTGTDTYGFVITIASGNTFVDADAYFIALGF